MADNPHPQPQQSKSLTAEEQLLSRLMHHQKHTRSRKRFFVKEGDKVFLQFFKAAVKERGRLYEANREIEEIISRVGRWVSDPNAPFGLILGGMPGNGKTTTVRALQLLINLSELDDPVNLDYHDNPAKANLRLVNANELAVMFEKQEELYRNLRKVGILAIDDVGLEPLEYNKYGNIMSPLLDLFYYRYENRLMTIFTTNLTYKSMTERYGERFADRCNEMMYTVGYPCHTFRHNDYE